ncbi:allantoinase AllB [Nocardioides sp. AN3]
MLDLVVRARRAVVGGRERPISLGIRDGTIVDVADFCASPATLATLELADDEVLLPGLVDSHVHVNEPGRTEWEGFASATRAAAAGGVTTIIDMPLNSIPPTLDPGALAVKRQAAKASAWVDVAFWGGAVPQNLGALDLLWDEGVLGFKCFLVASGVDEFGHLDRAQLEHAMIAIAALDGLLLVHAEDSAAIDAAPAAVGRSYASFLASRPPAAETSAVGEVAALAKRTGCRVHVVHLSSAETVDVVVAARQDGVRITCETCPHYLTLDAAEVPDGATTYKCCPPIRDAGNRDRLWDALRAGHIDLVVSDHSPAPPDLKCLDSGEFGAAWGGIASLQLGLPLVWSEARRRGSDLTDVARWMSTAPARMAGLRDRGRLDLGASADFCVFAPDEELVVTAESLHHRHGLTPYLGRQLTGVVRGTWLRGARLDLAGEPRGRLLTRPCERQMA